MSLKRSDRQYIEVEEFKDYELTHCIAYEMAIRNCEVIKLKNKIDELLKIVWYEFIEARDNDTELLEEYEKTEEEYNKQYYDDDFDNDDLNIPDFHQYFLDRNNNSLLIKEKTQTLLNDYWVRHIYVDGIINEAATMLGEDSTISPDIFQNKQVKRLKEHGFLGIFEQVGVSKDNRVVSSRDIGFAFGRSDNTCKEVDLNKTVRSQRLESLVIPKKYDTSIKIKINPHLPKNELIALIEKIKDNYTQDPSMIRSPLELLGLEIKMADNLVCNDKGEKCFDPRSILSKQEKMADMFYIYDCLKLGDTQRKIQNEVYNYYANKGNTNITLDNATLRKYRDIATDYIDNKKYKEMLTGINIDHLTNM